MASHAPRASMRGSLPARARTRTAGPVSSRKHPGQVAGDVHGGLRVLEIQRSRLLTAAAGVIDELGYSRTTVTDITRRARVSRRTFYDLFEDREDCMLAVFEDVIALLRREVLATVGAEGRVWRERVRIGLWTILSFLDREPVLARVCVVQASRSGTRALERREEVLRELADILDGGREEGARSKACPQLTAEGLVGAVFGILYGRLLKDEHPLLTDLFGELMSMIALPYLGPGAARKELTRPAPDASLLVGNVYDTESAATRTGRYEHDPLADLPMRLTYRTARVIEALAVCPGASNRVVGERSGVSDQGQISRLLARLERLGLVLNSGAGQAHGEPNVWRLTELGEGVRGAIELPGDSGSVDKRGRARVVEEG
jgi:AcrR family transcriptional regulator